MSASAERVPAVKVSVRYNRGYQDGAQAAKNNWRAQWLKAWEGVGSYGSHFDKKYVDGYWAGYEATKHGIDTDAVLNPYKVRAAR